MIDTVDMRDIAKAIRQASDLQEAAMGIAVYAIGCEKGDSLFREFMGLCGFPKGEDWQKNMLSLWVVDGDAYNETTCSPKGADDPIWNTVIHPEGVTVKYPVEQHDGLSDYEASMAGPVTLRNLWEIAEDLILKSGDEHHIFIEALNEWEPGVLTLATGS